MQPYKPHLVAAAIVFGLLILVGLAGGRGMAAAFVAFFVMMVDPIVLAAAILAGALIRPFGWMIAGGIVAGIAIHILVVALNERAPPTVVLLLRVLGTVTLALAAHAIVSAIGAARRKAAALRG